MPTPSHCLARSESVSVANPLDGDRNCLTRACQKKKKDLRITAGFWVGALSSTGVGPHQKKTGPDATDTVPKATKPRPKATATRKRPEPHPENKAQKEWGSNRETLAVTGSGRPRFQIQCRSRPGEPLSEHATSGPTPLPPLVTVRAGT